MPLDSRTPDCCSRNRDGVGPPRGYLLSRSASIHILDAPRDGRQFDHRCKGSDVPQWNPLRSADQSSPLSLVATVSVFFAPPGVRLAAPADGSLSRQEDGLMLNLHGKVFFVGSTGPRCKQPPNNSLSGRLTSFSIGPAKF